METGPSAPFLLRDTITERLVNKATQFRHMARGNNRSNQYITRARARIEASQALDRLIAEANGEIELTQGERDSCKFLVSKALPTYKQVEIHAEFTLTDDRSATEGALIEAGLDPQEVWAALPTN